MELAVHPRWFYPAAFSRAVFNYTLVKIGFLRPEERMNLDNADAEFRDAVETVGKAVFTLQVMIRERLRPLFIESINLVAGVADGSGYCEIKQFFGQGYLKNDIYKVILANFAVIAELFIFFSDFGLPISRLWYHVPWCNIYTYQIRTELAYRGGWERLRNEARVRYIDNKLYSDVLRSFENNTSIPHGETSDINNWPENPLAYLEGIFDELPSRQNLAMDILRTLYAHRPGMVPRPEEEFLWLAV